MVSDGHFQICGCPLRIFKWTYIFRDCSNNVLTQAMGRKSNHALPPKSFRTFGNITKNVFRHVDCTTPKINTVSKKTKGKISKTSGGIYLSRKTQLRIAYKHVSRRTRAERTVLISFTTHLKMYTYLERKKTIISTFVWKTGWKAPAPIYVHFFLAVRRVRVATKNCVDGDVQGNSGRHR